MNTIKLSEIRADTSAQPRASILTDKVAEYVERMMEGDVFPPMVVFSDGRVNWLADGFHRYHAAIGIGLETFACEVRKGGLRDAVLFSCGANAAHGVPRTNEDKRRAVLKLLNDEEWSHWSDSVIARHAKVDHKTVARYRDEIAFSHLGNSQDRPRTVERGGTTYTQNTAAIGKRPISPEPAGQEPTGFVEAWKREMAKVLPPPSAAMVQHQRDLENGFISTAIWEIQRRIGELPSPADTAERFPHHHRHTLTRAMLFEMAEWLRLFADAFVEEVTNVAAE